MCPIRDLNGQRFGRLLVTEYAGIKRDVAHWLCECDCGNEATVASRNLINGHTFSCGCYQKERARETKIIDLMNMRFGRLLVVEMAERWEYISTHRDIWWKCLCDCGNDAIVSSLRLRGGHTKSCGCLRREICQHGLKEGEASFNKLFSQYKRQAKNRNIIFELTKEEFAYITKLNCYYCGKEPSQEFGARSETRMNGHYIYNGVDRKDNNEGYINKNVVPCCGFCNMSKKNLPEEIFLLWIERIYNYKIRGQKIL